MDDTWWTFQKFLLCARLGVVWVESWYNPLPLQIQWLQLKCRECTKVLYLKKLALHLSADSVFDKPIHKMQIVYQKATFHIPIPC